MRRARNSDDREQEPFDLGLVQRYRDRQSLAWSSGFGVVVGIIVLISWLQGLHRAASLSQKRPRSPAGLRAENFPSDAVLS
jgi:hypothetical protein